MATKDSESCQKYDSHLCSVIARDWGEKPVVNNIARKNSIENTPKIKALSQFDGNLDWPINNITKLIPIASAEIDSKWNGMKFSKIPNAKYASELSRSK